jgi:hypothetical protein
MAEVAVHLSIGTLPDDYYMLTVYLPDKLNIFTPDLSAMPDRWNQFPFIEWTKQLGDDFIKTGKFCILKVPSAVTKGDYNILINPAHPDFKKIKIIDNEKFPFDQRLFLLK